MDVASAYTAAFNLNVDIVVAEDFWLELYRCERSIRFHETYNVYFLLLDCERMLALLPVRERLLHLQSVHFLWSEIMNPSNLSG